MKWHPLLQDDRCIRYNGFGQPYEELTCFYPEYKNFFLPFELRFDPAPYCEWMGHHPWIPLITVGLYMGLIYYGKYYYFAKREPWNCRTLLAFWNFSLSAFSCIGFLRVLPHFIHNFTNYTIKENFCMIPESSHGSGTTGLWIFLFVSSKFPELFDTFFIVVHKKPLIFLHWYHHVSVLLFCWQSYVSRSPVGIIFTLMNYAVHSFMYFYYFLMAIHKKPKFIKAVYITVSQISQMVVGVAVTIYGCYLLWFDPEVQALKNTDSPCAIKSENIMAALGLYGSYLALFLEFFLARYLKKSFSKKPKEVIVDSKSKATSNGYHHPTSNTNGSNKISSRKED